MRPKSDHDEERLLDAVLLYLQARDDGRSLNVAELVARYPDLRDELDTFLEDEDEITSLLKPLRANDGCLRADLLPTKPHSFGRYQLLEEIGRGGMGVVYKAKHVGLDRLVALKMIRLDCAVSSANAQRFRNEIESIAALDHPHIVPIFDVGEHDGQLFYTMPLLDGGNLSKQLATWPKQPRQAVVMVVALARALHHAHERGILHRDVKPSNILLDSKGHSFVTDFGLAKRADADVSLTETGAIIGTPTYIAPEHAFGAKQATTASDVYGLGAVLYSLLAGRPPFEGANPWDILRLVREQDPERLTPKNQGVNEDLEAICFKSLDKDPNKRYRSAELFADDLERYLAGKPIQARPIGRVERARRWCRRNPIVAALTASLAILLMVALATLATSYVLVSQARRVAEKQAGVLGKRVYAGDMHRAFGLWQAGDHDSLRTLLASYEPRSGEEELRGFEWRYLNSLLKRIPTAQVCYRGHTGVPFHATFSPDGNTVASAGEDCSIHFWNAATGEVFGIIPGDPSGERGHSRDINWIDYSPDGEQLASGSEDGTVRLWSVKTRTMLAVFEPFAGIVETVDISTDGNWLAAADISGDVRIWNLRDNRKLACELHTGMKGVASVVFPSKEPLILVGAGQNVACWNFTEAEEVWKAKTLGWIFCLTVSPDGKQVWAVDLSGFVTAFDVEDGSVVTKRIGHFERGRGICYSPRGQEVASCGSDRRVEIWLPEREEVFVQFRPHTEQIWSVMYSPDGRRIVTTSSDKTVRVWNLGTPQSTQIIPGTRASIAWAPDSDYLAISYEKKLESDNSTHCLEIRSLREARVIDSMEIKEDFDVAFTWSADSQSLFYSDDDGGIWSWNRTTHERRQMTPSLKFDSTAWMAKSVIGIAVEEDARQISLFCGDGTVRVWELASQSLHIDQCYKNEEVVRAIPGTESEIIVVHLRALRFWDRHERSWSSTELKPASGSITSGAVSLDGRFVAMGLSTGGIMIFDRAANHEARTLASHRAAVNSLLFSQDGRTLLSGSNDGTACLWNVESGQELFVLEDRHNNAITQLTFSPDGSTLSVCGSRFLDSSILSLHPLDR